MFRHFLWRGVASGSLGVASNAPWRSLNFSAESSFGKSEVSQEMSTKAPSRKTEKSGEPAEGS